MKSFPTYLIPLDAFNAAEVVGPVREKTDREGARKRETWTGENRPGWIVPVEIVRGSRTKTLPGGAVREVLDTETINVTVLAQELPDVTPGSYVDFSGLGVGAVDGTAFFQALGVAPAHDSEFDLNFGGDDQ